MIQQFIFPALTALLASLATLAVFYFREYSSLKKQVQDLAAEKATPEKLAEIARQLEMCRSRVDDLERRRTVPFEAAAVVAAPAAASAATPANANRRGQVMRLHRSGESISSIASALGISQGEVKLMVKVQELLSDNGSVERSSDFL